jgi:hypothetical protein
LAEGHAASEVDKGRLQRGFSGSHGAGASAGIPAHLYALRGGSIRVCHFRRHQYCPMRTASLVTVMPVARLQRESGHAAKNYVLTPANEDGTVRLSETRSGKHGTPFPIERRT